MRCLRGTGSEMARKQRDIRSEFQESRPSWRPRLAIVEVTEVSGITQGESRVGRGRKEVQGYHLGVDQQRFKQRVKSACEGTRKGQTKEGKRKTRGVCKLKEERLLRGRK